MINELKRRKKYILSGIKGIILSTYIILPKLTFSLVVFCSLWEKLQPPTYNQGGVLIKLFSLFFLKTTDPSTIRLGCDDDNTLEDYELHDLKRKSILRGHNGPIYDVTFMPRSKYALSVSEDTTMRLWDLETGINKAMYQGHSYPIWSVDSDRVGINIATGKLTF